MGVDPGGGLTGMNRTGNVRLFLGEGEFDFALLMGQLMELEQLTGDGIFVTWNKLMNGTWKIADIRETLRLGLVGGGMAKKDAYDLVTRHLQPGYLADLCLLAQSVAGAACIGVPGETCSGEGEGAAAAPISPTAGSPGETSSPPPPPGASVSRI